MANYPYFVPPAVGSTIGSPAELEYLVSKALPGTNISVNWSGASAPDIVTYPEMDDMIWIDRTGPKPIKRVYNPATTSWEQELPANSSITDAMLAGGIGIGKLSVTGGTAGYVARINAGGTAVVYDSPENLFTAGGFRVSVTAVSLPATAGIWVVYSDGTATAWADLESIVSTITIDVSSISTLGAAEQKALSYLGGVLGYNYVELLLRDNETPVAKIKATGGDLFYMSNTAGSASVARTKTDVATLLKPELAKKFTSGGSDSIPAKGGLLTIAHTLTAKPDMIQIRLVCVTPEFGYVAGDDPLLDSFTLTDGGADDRNAIFAITSDTGNIYLRRDNNASLNISVIDKSTGLATLITEANWRVKAVAIYLP